MENSISRKKPNFKGKKIPRYAIGGQFEIDSLSLGKSDTLSKLNYKLPGTWTLSGRGAFTLILKKLKKQGIRHIHLPAYLCESLLLPIKTLGMDYSFYPVDAQLIAYPTPPEKSAVLLIHYFGKINPATALLRTGTGKNYTLIEDASQSPLSDWNAPKTLKRFVFLSYRKFGAAPFGGWCNILNSRGIPSKDTEIIAWQSLTARMLRAVYFARPDQPLNLEMENFYLEIFNETEKYLDEHATIIAIPQIALDVIAGIDWQAIGRIRRANWKILNDILSRYVETVITDLKPGEVPSGYIIKSARRDLLKAKLAEQRIFCPIHWRLPHEVNPKLFTEAANIANTCLTLPIDQRYGENDMIYMAEKIKSIWKTI